MVTECWMTFPRFGDDGSTLPVKVEVFRKALAIYETRKIAEAFTTYLRKGRAFPVPADIIDIIEPPFAPDKQLYGRILAEMKSGTAFVTRKERQYVADYEQHVLNEAGAL